MPSPRSGTAGSAVTPSDPQKPQEADNANPGEVDAIKTEQRQTQTGKYGSAKTQPYKPPKDKSQKTSWIELELVDHNNQPVSGAAYRVTLADETVAEGTLDDKGFVRLEPVPPGSCKVTFPKFDRKAWKKV